MICVLNFKVITVVQQGIVGTVLKAAEIKDKDYAAVYVGSSLVVQGLLFWCLQKTYKKTTKKICNRISYAFRVTKVACF